MRSILADPFRRHSARRASLLAALSLAVLGFAAIGSAATPGSADLKVAKSASAGSVDAGATLTYTIQVENLGPDTATGVTVTDPLPQGADYVSATSTQGSCSLQGRKVTCAVGTLEAGPGAKVSSATVTLGVIPRRAGTIDNTATAKADQKDPVAANNRATATVRVLGPAPTASCRGVPATIVGTAGDDQLLGSGGRDVIAGLGGNDTISSLAGRDLVCAGAHADRVAAGAAADRVFGGGGRDSLLGRAGPDLLQGGAGNDVLKGGAGADRLRGGAGADVCRGGPGLDSTRSCER